MNDLDRMRAAADKIGPKAGDSGVMADVNAAIAKHREAVDRDFAKRVPRPEVHVSDEDAWKRIDDPERFKHLFGDYSNDPDTVTKERDYWRARAEAAEAKLSALAAILNPTSATA